MAGKRANIDKAYWRATYPRGVVDPIGPHGDPVTTSTDRRLLWHLESMLAVSGTTQTHREEQRRLSEYLHETCEHEWIDYEAEEGYAPAHRQCLWCNDVDWKDEA